MASLGEARGLEELEISGTPVNTDDLAPLAALPKLRFLDLAGTGITNHALATLAGSRSIETLRIGGNPIDVDGGFWRCFKGHTDS